jgi:putative glycosyltransferase (TIGR04372 family)
VLSAPLTNPARTPHSPRTPLAKSKSPKLSQVNLKSKLRKKLLVIKVIGLKKTLYLPIALIFVVCLLLISKFVPVNIHRIYNSRIGHFALNTEISATRAREKEGRLGRRIINLYCFESLESANTFLETLWKRTLTCLTGNFGWAILDIARRVKKQDFFIETEAIDREGYLDRSAPTLKFNDAELKTGKVFLQSIGLDIDTKFVCLNVRDDSFLAKTKPVGWHSNRDWSYHNYRDSDIKTYVAAAEAMANMGYTVFRMGAIVKEPLVSTHPRVIDYATNGMRTEFLDIFLGAHCTFAISVGSGWDSVPTIFRRPIMFVNQLPVFAPSAITLPIVTYPKILHNAQNKDCLGLKSLIEHEVVDQFTSQAYRDAGVEIRDLSSEELVEAVNEIAQRVEGTFIETPEQKEMQAKLKHILSTHPKLHPSPNYYPIRAQFASCFLSRYSNFLD